MVVMATIVGSKIESVESYYDIIHDALDHFSFSARDRVTNLVSSLLKEEFVTSKDIMIAYQTIAEYGNASDWVDAYTAMVTAQLTPPTVLDGIYQDTLHNLRAYADVEIQDDWDKDFKIKWRENLYKLKQELEQSPNFLAYLARLNSVDDSLPSDWLHELFFGDS